MYDSTPILSTNYHNITVLIIYVKNAPYCQNTGEHSTYKFEKRNMIRTRVEKISLEETYK